MTKLPEGYASPHFKYNEFRCRHCGELHPSGDTPPQTLLGFLENIRAHFGGLPTYVNSGYRCPTHNDAVGGATYSRHLEGDAIDFYIPGASPSLVYEYADKLIGDAGGVGKYNSFTHIDLRGSAARW